MVAEPLTNLKSFGTDFDFVPGAISATVMFHKGCRAEEEIGLAKSESGFDLQLLQKHVPM